MEIGGCERVAQEFCQPGNIGIGAEMAEGGALDHGGWIFDGVPTFKFAGWEC